MRHTHGSIEVVCGSMFSGKTDELIRRLVRATIAKQKVQVFKPAIDVRYAVEKVTSHAGSNYDATPVEKSIDILAKLEKDTTVVAIDEAQFFDPGDRPGRPATRRHAASASWWPDSIPTSAASRLVPCRS